MTGQSARAATAPDAIDALLSFVGEEASAAHPHVRTLLIADNAIASRNLADALHHLSMLHGRHPGVLDHAAARTTEPVARKAMFALAEIFVGERDMLGRLVVAAGPIPSTPGQSESEASVVAQRHAIEMLAQSDRQGCALGAGLALALDWHMVRRVMLAGATRFGVETRTAALPGALAIAEIARAGCTTSAMERALVFGGHQIAQQHRGLWDLMEARARARPD